MDIVDKLNLDDYSFLGRYIKYCIKLTDAPKVFHLGAGLTALAACCGSEITFPGFGGRTYWPNLYTLLISPSGLYRKSTSLGIAQDLISEVNRDLLAPGEQTRERFISALKDHPSCFYPISEFAAMLSLWQREYMMGMREIVVDLYDPHLEYTRQTQKEKVIIKKPAVNILAASTLEWLREKLSEGDLRGGLMGRFMLFPGLQRELEKGLVVESFKDEKDWLVQFLKDIHSIEHSWIDMRGIREPYNLWLSSVERAMEGNINPELIGFQSRIGNHCLKLLAIITVSAYGPKPKYEPTTNDLNQAIMLAGWLLEQSEQLAVTGFTKSKTELQVQKLLQMSSRNGGVDKSTALRNMHLQSRELDQLIATAVDRGQIVIEREKHGNRMATILKLKTDDKPNS